MITPLVLSFDLDDTLWPVGPVIAAAESALLSWLRARYPRAVVGHSPRVARPQPRQQSALGGGDHRPHRPQGVIQIET